VGKADFGFPASWRVQATIEALQHTLRAEQHKSAEKLQQRLQRRRDRLQRDLAHHQEMNAEAQAEHQAADIGGNASAADAGRSDEGGVDQGDVETQRKVRSLKQQHEQRRREDQNALNSRQVRKLTSPSRAVQTSHTQSHPL
jgi:hypothetical protein